MNKTAAYYCDLIQKVLDGLGNTPEQIAHNLEWAEIKGMKQDENCCAIANFLTIHLARDHDKVKHVIKTGCVILYDPNLPNGENYLGVVCFDEPMLKFIKKFDAGEFPQLLGKAA